MPATLHSSFFTPPPTLACVARAPREAPRRFSHASIRRQRSLPLDFGSLPVCGRWAPVLNALRPFFGQRVDLPRCWASPASRSCRLQERFSAVSSRWCVGGLVEESARAAVSLEGSVEGSLSSLVPDTHPTSASVLRATTASNHHKPPFLAIIQVAWQGFYVYDRIKYRHIPGPAPSWLAGHIPIIMKKYDMLLFYAFRDWKAKYGRVFKWFWGPQCVITISGACVCRRLWRARRSAARIGRSSRGGGRASGRRWQSSENAARGARHTVTPSRGAPGQTPSSPFIIIQSSPPTQPKKH